MTFFVTYVFTVWREDRGLYDWPVSKTREYHSFVPKEKPYHEQSQA